MQTRQRQCRCHTGLYEYHLKRFSRTLLAPGARIDLGGEFNTAVSLAVENGRIARIYAIGNPHKLARLERDRRTDTVLTGRRTTPQPRTASARA